MSLAAGTMLGPSEIAAPIGAGGMGEVYRARDTRLHRDVAVKVLPPAVAADRDRPAIEAENADGTDVTCHWQHRCACLEPDAGAREGTTTGSLRRVE